jgi:hypothetical protein
VQDSLIKPIAGHEDGAVTFSIYGSRSPLKAISAALRHIISPSTDSSHSEIAAAYEKSVDE